MIEIKIFKEEEKEILNSKIGDILEGLLYLEDLTDYESKEISDAIDFIQDIKVESVNTVLVQPEYLIIYKEREEF